MIAREKFRHGQTVTWSESWLADRQQRFGDADRFRGECATVVGFGYPRGVRVRVRRVHQKWPVTYHMDVWEPVPPQEE